MKRDFQKCGFSGCICFTVLVFALFTNLQGGVSHGLSETSLEIHSRGVFH